MRNFVGITSVSLVLLLAGCTGLPNSAPAEPGTSKHPKEESAELTVAELNSLIRSVPEEDSIDSLKKHFLAIDSAASRLEPFEIEYTRGPTAIQSKVDTVVGKFSEKLKMFQLLGLDSLDQDWVIASEKDYQWWVDFRLSQDSSYEVSLWNDEANELGHCGLSADVFCGAGHSRNGKNYQDNVVGTAFSGRGLDAVSRHEAAHFYQAVFGYGGKCWVAEGQATFFETFLESSSRSRTEVISRLRGSSTGIAELSEPELLAQIETDQICQGDSNIAYDLGMLGFEYLYLNFSFLDVHNFQVVSSTKGWNQAAPEVLLIEASELDSKIASYIYSQLN